MNTNLALIVLALAVTIAGALYYLKPNTPPFGAANSGTQATIATSSYLGLAASTATRIFATSTCTSRIITSSTTALMLTFSDIQGVVPSQTVGILQASSTTATYDSGLWGCGAVRAWSISANNINVVETR